MQPNETFWVVFGWFGILTIAGLVMLMAYCAFDSLRSVINEWRWQYKYKHRFDKPPTAKCYCKDCVHHGKNGNDYGEKCGLPGVDRFTPHNGFCYMARPMTVKEAARNGKDD